jgi:hypothetical protein
MQISILKLVFAMLKERREKMQESGKKGYRLIKSLVEQHSPQLPWLIMRNMVHHFIATYTKRSNSQPGIYSFYYITSYCGAK